jgi:two-component sensor histidine kinase
LHGRITLTWKLVDDFLELEWKEDAGPQVQIPSSRGFGTRSVIASIETQLGGRAKFDWRPEGLCCQLLVPLAEPSDLPGQLAPAEPGRGNAEPGFISGQRLRDAASN